MTLSLCNLRFPLMDPTILLVLTGLCAVGAPVAGVPTPSPQASTTATPMDTEHDPEIVALLDRLAKNNEGLTGFTARITFQTTDALLGRNETRTGSMIYDVKEDDGARFAATFDSEVVGRRKRKYEKHYIFDGRWLAEVDYKRKQFIKREVVAPGEEFDPLKLGEGPLALPIGQERDAVLRRFDVVPIERPRSGMLASLPLDIVGISLTPHPGTAEAEELARLDLFFDARTLLPLASLMIEPANMDGESNTKTIMLRGVVRNPTLSREQLMRLDISEPDPAEWKIDVRAWGDG